MTGKIRMVCLCVLTGVFVLSSTAHSAMDVRRWLIGLGLGEYAEVFEQNDIKDRQTLQQLTEEDLEYLGVTSLGHRKKLVKAISELGSSEAEPRYESRAPQRRFDRQESSSETGDNVVVEVHQSHSGTNLWYHVGIVNPRTRSIKWGDSHRYDIGKSPMCVKSGNLVIEVHQGHDDTKLWYTIGTIDSGALRIEWVPSTEYDEGRMPTIAMNGKILVEMHQSHTGTNLWYHIGILDPVYRTISWGPSESFDKGRVPSIGF